MMLPLLLLDSPKAIQPLRSDLPSGSLFSPPLSPLSAALSAGFSTSLLTSLSAPLSLVSGFWCLVSGLAKLRWA
jgi:hypothetical protein